MRSHVVSVPGAVLVAVLVGVLAVGVTGCGDDGDDLGAADGGAVTTAAPAAPAGDPAGDPASLTSVRLGDGTVVAHPSDWTNFGEGPSGSLELGVPDVGTVSVRSPAASAYLYGPMWAEVATSDEALAMMAGAVGVGVGSPTTLTTDSGDTVLASVVGPSVLMVTDAGPGFASLLVNTTADGWLALDLFAEVLGSLEP